jgi:hypothetical protein
MAEHDFKYPFLLHVILHVLLYKLNKKSYAVNMHTCKKCDFMCM